MSIVINYTGRTGSGPWHSYTIAKSFIENGYEVIAIISSSACNVQYWQKLELKKLVILDTYTDAKALIIESIRFKVKREKIEKILCNETIDYILCPMITMWTRKINKIFRNIPKCIFVHDFVPHDKKLSVLTSKIFGYEKVVWEADVIVVHSKIYIEAVEKKYNKCGQVFYVPLTDLNIYKNISSGDSVMEYDKSKVNFLFFGRIEEYKGLHLLLDAFQRLSAIRNDVTLTIAGNGDLSKYYASIDKISNVRILNRWIEDDEVHSILNGENIIMIMPYVNASQSGPVVLAKDYNIPCIVTNVGGLSEQIVSNITGIIVEPTVESLLIGMQQIGTIEIINQYKQSIMQYKNSKEEEVNQAYTINKNIVHILENR